MPITATGFREALAQFATGITVVTAQDGRGQRYGMTVSAFCSVSLEPPLILVCVGERCRIHAALQVSCLFGVSVLSDEQEALSQRFASTDEDKFVGLEVQLGPQGALLVPGALAHLECSLDSSHRIGDHVVHVGHVLSAAARPGRPLLYHARSYRRLSPPSNERAVTDSDPGAPLPIGARP